MSNTLYIPQKDKRSKCKGRHRNRRNLWRLRVWFGTNTIHRDINRCAPLGSPFIFWYVENANRLLYRKIRVRGFELKVFFLSILFAISNWTLYVSVIYLFRNWLRFGVDLVSSQLWQLANQSATKTEQRKRRMKKVKWTNAHFYFHGMALPWYLYRRKISNFPFYM